VLASSHTTTNRTEPEFLRAAGTPGPSRGRAPRRRTWGPSLLPHNHRGCRHRHVLELSAPFDNQLGLVYTSATPDGATAHLAITPKLHQPAGIVHGGVYCSMIESMASVSAYVWLAANGGGQVVGVNNNTDFLRAVSEGTVFGTSEPVHRGRRQQLWLVTIRDDTNRLIARGQVRLQNLEPGH